jgi:hypothetical protein
MDKFVCRTNINEFEWKFKKYKLTIGKEITETKIRKDKDKVPIRSKTNATVGISNVKNIDFFP